ncbi:MAG TPA: hypothetical protein VFF67_10695 [Thermoplasmata archaeon]|nr:hypothetical protein [Thermoplasmata archaeon]
MAVLLASSLLVLSATSTTGSSTDRSVPGGPDRSSLHFSPSLAIYSSSTINYTSSVDGFLLSYVETLPAGFNKSRTYPLAVELHGLTGETVPISGGLPSYVVPTTAQAAAAAGFILLNPNTRTGSGWYINSNYTGPQEQDILDAIAMERTVRHIGSVYLFGESMGSIGTLEIGLDHPHLFRGLGAIASFSDFFEMYDYLNSTAYSYLTQFMLLPSGGALPNASAYARGIFVHLSSLRFHPQNLSGQRLYVANGAQDVLASNNLSLWPYQQENNTLVNRTCLTSTTFAEPSNCTTPVGALAALHPGQFAYRYVFEPNGPHDYYLMNASDMFAFWLGQRPSGTYWGHWPIPTLVAPPQPIVTVATFPWGCGAVRVGGHALHSGDVLVTKPGNYSMRIRSCGNLSVRAVRANGGLRWHGLTMTLSVNGSGAIVVTFTSPGRGRGAGRFADRGPKRSSCGLRRLSPG